MKGETKIVMSDLRSYLSGGSYYGDADMMRGGKATSLQLLHSRVKLFLHLFLEFYTWNQQEEVHTPDTVNK